MSTDACSLNDPPRAPPSSAQPRQHKTPIRIRVRGDGALRMSAVIAQSTGRSDVLAAIASTIAASVQVLCGAAVGLCLPSREAIPCREGGRLGEPHGLVAVAAQAALTNEGRSTRRYESAGHAGLQCESWIPDGLGLRAGAGGSTFRRCPA